MNIVIVCFLGNHVSNALQNPAEMLVVSNQFDDSFHKSHHYKFNVSSAINPNLHKPKPVIMLLNLSMKKNNSYMELNEINLLSVLLDYVFSFIFTKPLKRHVKKDLNYSKKSNENDKVINIIGKEPEKADLLYNKLKVELAENDYNIRMTSATQNDHTIDRINPVLQKKETKYTLSYSKINRESENYSRSLANLNNTSLLDEISNVRENKSQEPSGKTMLNDFEKALKFSGEKSQDSLKTDNLRFESSVSEGRQEVDVRVQDSVNVSGDINIHENPKKDSKMYKSIKVQSGSSFIKIQQLNNKNSLSFHPKLFKLVFTNIYKNHSPSITLRTLSPRTLVKRSVPSAITRQFETPTSGNLNFPFSEAGSSLYGSYAYAHSRPSGFGGEGGESGEPIGGGEGVIQPTEGEHEGAE